MSVGTPGSLPRDCCCGKSSRLVQCALENAVLSENCLCGTIRDLRPALYSDRSIEGVIDPVIEILGFLSQFLRGESF